MTGKKRVLSFIIALLMMLAMMPAGTKQAFAESDLDTEKPVIDLTSLRVSLPEGKEKVTVDDTITVSFDVTDDRQVVSAFLDLYFPVTSGYVRVNLEYAGTTPETGNGTWTGTYTIQAEDENGIWRIELFGANDTRNSTIYGNNQIHPYGDNPMDLSAYDFEVYGTSSDPDLKSPVIDLDSLRVSLPEGKEKVTVDDTITVSFDVTDDRQVVSAFLDLYTPVTSGYKRVNLTYAGTDPETGNGTWTGTYTIQADDENGIWRIELFGANDTRNSTIYGNSQIHPYGDNPMDLSAYDFEVTAPDCPFDLTTPGYSLELDGDGATTTYGGKYYVRDADETVTPEVNVRFDAEDGTWNTLASRKYTLSYEKKVGDEWVEYTGSTFGLDNGEDAAYRVLATGKEDLNYTGTIGPVEFNVIRMRVVTFDTRGGTYVSPRYVIPGGYVSEPTARLIKDGWSFGYIWSLDEDLSTTFNFYNTPITEDITLHAIWYTEFKIGLYDRAASSLNQGGAVDVEASRSDGSHLDLKRTMIVSVSEGPLKLTARPAEGYAFIGWYRGVVGDNSQVEGPSEELLSTELVYNCRAGDEPVCAVFEGCVHQWDEGTVTKEATCSEPGKMLFTCTLCGAKKTEQIPADENAHVWEETVQKATPTANGRMSAQCSICGKGIGESEIIFKASSISLEKTSYAYTGKAIKPQVTVANSNGVALSEDEYTVTYASGCKNVGSYKVTVTLQGDRYEGSVELTFAITKATQTVTLSKTSYTKTFGDAAFSLDAKTNGDGALKYSSDNTKVATVSTAGKVTIKGAGTAKITVYAAAGTNYKKSASKTVTIKVNKAANPLAVKAKTATVKYADVKKKAQTLAVSKVIEFTKKGQGTLSYAKVSGNSKITINKTTGKVTVAKGLKKGTYKVKVTVKAAGNDNYKASAKKTVTFTITVK